MRYAIRCGLLVALIACAVRTGDRMRVPYAGTDKTRCEGTLVAAGGGKRAAEGIWRFYWRSGELQALGDYHAGALPSATDELENGSQIPLEGRFGHWCEWDVDGALVSEGNYLGGERVGTWVGYHPNGRVRSETIYAAGREQGLQTTWHSNGERASLGAFANGRRCGVHCAWDESGTLRQEGCWLDGREEGLHTTWDEHGQKREESQFRRGLLHGTRGLWNVRGELTCVSRYEDGLLEGEEVLFHPNGCVRQRGRYHAGEPVGRWAAWGEQGELAWVRDLGEVAALAGPVGE